MIDTTDFYGRTNEKTKTSTNLVQLLDCPCGKTPTELNLIEGSTCKWAHVTGNCCGEWNVEFRTEYNKIDTDECMKLAIDEWNRAPRPYAITKFKDENTDLMQLLATIDRFEKCFVRIAKAHGLTTPLELIAMGQDNEENYAEILARYIEKKMSG